MKEVWHHETQISKNLQDLMSSRQFQMIGFNQHNTVRDTVSLLDVVMGIYPTRLFTWCKPPSPLITFPTNWSQAAASTCPPATPTITLVLKMKTWKDHFLSHHQSLRRGLKVGVCKPEHHHCAYGLCYTE